MLNRRPSTLTASAEERDRKRQEQQQQQQQQQQRQQEKEQEQQSQAIEEGKEAEEEEKSAKSVAESAARACLEDEGTLRKKKKVSRGCGDDTSSGSESDPPSYSEVCRDKEMEKKRFFLFASKREDEKTRRHRLTPVHDIILEQKNMPVFEITRSFSLAALGGIAMIRLLGFKVDPLERRSLAKHIHQKLGDLLQEDRQVHLGDSWNDFLRQSAQVNHKHLCRILKNLWCPEESFKKMEPAVLSSIVYVLGFVVDFRVLSRVLIFAANHRSEGIDWVEHSEAEEEQGLSYAEAEKAIRKFRE